MPHTRTARRGWAEATPFHRTPNQNDSDRPRRVMLHIGGTMDRDQLARIALRYDTAMSRAMLRALGVPVPHGVPRRGSIARVDRYDGAIECMAQRHGVRM